jgi:hypothetical protein
MLFIAGLGALFVGFLALFWLTPLGVPVLKQLGGGQASPDLQFGYRADETYRLLDLYGPRGIAHWRRMLWLDMVFPAVYAALFSLLAAKWAQFVDAGPIWTACAIAALPRRRDAAIAGASLFTQAKFILSHATLAIPLLHWAVGLFA